MLTYTRNAITYSMYKTAGRRTMRYCNTAIIYDDDDDIIMAIGERKKNVHSYRKINSRRGTS